MKETMLRKDEVDLQRQMKEKAKDGTLKVVEEPVKPAAPKRRGRYAMHHPASHRLENLSAQP